MSFGRSLSPPLSGLHLGLVCVLSSYHTIPSIEYQTIPHKIKLYHTISNYTTQYQTIPHEEIWVCFLQICPSEPLKWVVYVYYCTISYCNIPHRRRSCCPHVWNYTLLQSMMLSSELTIPFHTVLHQTKLNSTLLHRILFLRLASPEQHTLYVTLSSSLSSTIICPPQNPLAVLVLMFELLLCDINIRILLKTFQVLRLVQLGQWMLPPHHCKLWLNCNSSAHKSTWNWQ